MWPAAPWDRDVGCRTTTWQRRRNVPRGVLQYTGRHGSEVNLPPGMCPDNTKPVTMSDRDLGTVSETEERLRQDFCHKCLRLLALPPTHDNLGYERRCGPLSSVTPALCQQRLDKDDIATCKEFLLRLVRLQEGQNKTDTTPGNITPEKKEKKKYVYFSFFLFFLLSITPGLTVRIQKSDILSRNQISCVLR